ncbi:uncharacterized protein A4U43_C08F28760 [Asparagus officinalis]|nr:uncharacterized protein A4U43_C08F28760 [Asparagus officinalis]
MLRWMKSCNSNLTIGPSSCHGLSTLGRDNNWAVAFGIVYFGPWYGHIRGDPILDHSALKLRCGRNVIRTVSVRPYSDIAYLIELDGAQMAQMVTDAVLVFAERDGDGSLISS